MATFQRGHSGNPGGRPRVIAEIRDLARQHTEAAIRTLGEICEHGKTDAARVAAASALLDRGWGKPQQDVDVSGGLTLEQLVVASMERQSEEK